MKKLALLLLICFSFLAASAQTTPVSPKGPVQASPYHEASTNRMWLFNPTFGWFVIPDSTYIKKFIGADTLRFKAGQFKNIGTSTAVKIALQTDTQKTTPIYYLGIDPTTKNLRYDTTQFGTASGGYLPLTLTHDTTVSAGAYSLQFRSGNASDLAIDANEIFSVVQSGVNSSGFDVQSGFMAFNSQGTADVSTFETDNTGGGAQITYQKNGSPLTFKRFILNDGGTGISVEDGIDHIGLNGVQVFPLSGSPNQYAQYGKVDSLITAHSSGVSSFNTRTGAVALLSSDVTTALGFTPVPNTRNVNTGPGLAGGGALSSDLTLKPDTTILATKYYASTVVGGDGVLTGLATTTVTTTAATTAGTYRLNNLLVTKGTSTNTTIPTQDATLNRYTLIVGDASGTFTAVNGTLATDPVEPAIPANKALIATIYIPVVGGTVTTTGGGSGKGTVTKVTSSTTDILVANQTTAPIITLNKVNGFAISFYDPTSSIQTQLNSKLSTTTASTTYVPLTRTVNGKALSSNITLGLASSDFANQGTTTTLLHGNASGNPSFSQVVNADIASATIDLTTKVTGLLPVANGGTGTSTPAIVAGTNITVSGTWPNQTINATGGFTNPMTTTGDIIYSSSGSTPARLGIGGANTVLHGGTTPSYSAIVNGDITNSTIDLTTKVTAVLPVLNGGSGTSTPSLVAGTNVTITGTWPNQTINSTGGGSGVTTVGTFSGSSQTNGASISTFTITFGPADGTNPGMVTTGTQTFGGVKTLATPVFTGLPTGTGVASAATASTLVARDANGIINVNNTNQGYTTQNSNAGPYTLTVASTYQQVFTGGSNVVVTMPVASTMTLGQSFDIISQTSGTVTLNSSGGNAILVMPTNTSATITCVLTSGTSAASWLVTYYGAQNGVSIAPGSSSQVIYNLGGTLSTSSNFSFSAAGGTGGTGLLTLTGNLVATKGYTDNNGIGLYTITGGNTVLQGYHAIQLGGTTAGTSGLSSVGTGVDDYTVVIPVGAVGAAGLAILGKTSQTANYFEVTTAANKATTHGDVFKIASDGTSKFFFPLTTNGTINKLTPSAVNTSATLTVAQMGTGYITSTSAAPVTMTTATATALATQLGAVQGTWYDLTIDNTGGASTVTLALGSGFTQLTGVSSSLTVPTGTTGVGTWRINFVSTTAATIARIE